MPLLNFNYVLSWSDFIKKPSRPAGSSEDAQIHPELEFKDFKLNGKGKSVSIADLTITIRVVKADSWVVNGTQSNDLLNHEQGHYDILAISAREFYAALKKLSAATTHALQTELSKLQEEALKKVTRVDARYDIQTKHSLDKVAQNEWNKKIAAEKQKPDGSIDNLPA